MDDFGTGYSSLNTLGNLNIDELNLDRSFLLAASKKPVLRFRIIMEHIFQLSKKLHIETIVEGVKTNEHEQFIRELSCDYAQRYFFTAIQSVFRNLKHFTYKSLPMKGFYLCRHMEFFLTCYFPVFLFFA